jgi:hypothetical protein
MLNTEVSRFVNNVENQVKFAGRDGIILRVMNTQKMVMFHMNTSQEINMPNKKSNNLKLDFTGKMSILIELKDYGPMQYRINDFDTVMKIMRVILDASNNTTTVDSYNAQEQKTFQKILDGIE